MILDAGGGPGRYAVILAKKGYRVVLSDLEPENLKLAKRVIGKEHVGEYIIGINTDSIVDLSRYPENSFDATLCLGGSLSHVKSVAGRIRAIKELRRITKKGAPIFISVIGKLGTIMRGPISWPDELLFTKEVRRLTVSGDDYRWRRKYFAHYFMLDELERLVKQSGLRIIERVGLEGLSNPSENAINQLARNKKAWRNWREIHRALYTHPTVVDMSSHFMVVAKSR